ncbi:glycosyltransferase family 9 protein [Candidatus Methylospira mobilis]|uniref:glycosyltransferase family 9 protein n=1 Tax=Candidatus Methylospira mobilis TaxID=1808979 RepID=UPI0028E73228|nr:glycosyltransferase family 9 protein [Candidatus Methylospira mobilis]WNV06312.1 glycosyltransferase family 9 protein [Candidatus Methylospira mobilis]
MNINLQRMLDRWAGVPVCFFLSLWGRFISGRASPAQPKKILIILLSEMGSLVLAQPMFARLTQKYPGVSIHMLMFGKNREILELTGAVSAENIIALNDRRLGAFLQDCLRAIQRLRTERYDVVIDCEMFARTSSIFSRLSGAPLRVGFHPHTQEGLYRGSYINRPVPYNPYRHLSQQLLTLVDAIDSRQRPCSKTPVSAPPLSVAHLAFAGQELQQTAAALHDAFPTVRGRRLILVYPGGGILPIRAWPSEYYKILCRTLVEEGYAVGLIGLKEDKPLATEIVAHCRHENCVDLTGYTASIRHLLVLFFRAELLITNDGGPAQFSALTPIYSMVFFGPETPQLYGALSGKSWNFFESYPCSPCLTAYNHRNSPCDGDNRCISSISPERVLNKAREILRNSRTETTRSLENA